VFKSPFSSDSRACFAF